MIKALFKNPAFYVVLLIILVVEIWWYNHQKNKSA